MTQIIRKVNPATLSDQKISTTKKPLAIHSPFQSSKFPSPRGSYPFRNTSPPPPPPFTSSPSPFLAPLYLLPFPRKFDFLNPPPLDKTRNCEKKKSTPPFPRAVNPPYLPIIHISRKTHCYVSYVCIYPPRASTPTPP